MRMHMFYNQVAQNKSHHSNLLELMRDHRHKKRAQALFFAIQLFDVYKQTTHPLKAIH